MTPSIHRRSGPWPRRSALIGRGRWTMARRRISLRSSISGSPSLRTCSQGVDVMRYALVGLYMAGLVLVVAAFQAGGWRGLSLGLSIFACAVSLVAFVMAFAVRPIALGRFVTYAANGRVWLVVNPRRPFRASRVTMDADAAEM